MANENKDNGGNLSQPVSCSDTNETVDSMVENGVGVEKKKRDQRNLTNQKLVDAIAMEELECVICKELPSNHIYQCLNGHFLCRQCNKQLTKTEKKTHTHIYKKKKKRIRESKNSICPVCRVRVSRRAPARNHLAEKYLASLEMPCINEPCKAKFQFAFLKQHIEQECKYRMTVCRYEPLGCDWKGLAKDRSKHDCKTKGLPASQLLTQVVAKKMRENDEREKIKQTDSKYVEISKIWESRCRNIVTRDVILEAVNSQLSKTKQNKTKIMQICFSISSNGFILWTVHTYTHMYGQAFDNEGIIYSRPFHALHYCWFVEIKQIKEKNENKNGTDHARLKLRLVLEKRSELRHRLLLHVCVLRGPDTVHSFYPISFECEFTRKDTQSQWVDLTAIGNVSAFIESMSNETNLRIVLIDKRRGDVSHSFRADEERGTSESSFEVDDYSDAESVYSDASNTGSESRTDAFLQGNKSALKEAYCFVALIVFERFSIQPKTFLAYKTYFVMAR
ncbi:hypothetical protein RFI_30058 [Reticulomyxa filosa]|uniref:TRAF-type domain-containing protein n=1 Tax=Reticulomyxa filosa TaxID=46433 RepID=X6M2V5_RETFI|nr:hypothetical protein RFI_30058 [Reticulomyxa filosa]|eukprot:ETO07335.1 hypothetical protein RFI_30058 [Reticulomyxa filosa]